MAGREAGREGRQWKKKAVEGGGIVYACVSFCSSLLLSLSPSPIYSHVIIISFLTSNILNHNPNITCHYYSLLTNNLNLILL